jgi:hypothetical protein
MALVYANDPKLQVFQHSEGAAEQACASHVQQLLSKLPAEQVASHAHRSRPGVQYNLKDFFLSLQDKAECQAVATQVGELHQAPSWPQMRDRQIVLSQYSYNSAWFRFYLNPHSPNNLPHPQLPVRPLVDPGTCTVLLYCDSRDHTLTH